MEVLTWREVDFSGVVLAGLIGGYLMAISGLWAGKVPGLTSFDIADFGRRYIVSDRPSAWYFGMASQSGKQRHLRARLGRAHRTEPFLAPPARRAALGRNARGASCRRIDRPSFRNGFHGTPDRERTIRHNQYFASCNLGHQPRLALLTGNTLMNGGVRVPNPVDILYGAAFPCRATGTASS